VPTLAEMAEQALIRLDDYDRFLLQVEGGRVDHGAHSSDAAGMLFDQLAFDEALDVCLAYQARRPDTLVVITTDHGNSNPALNGMGSGYGESGALLANLGRYRSSFGPIKDRVVAKDGTVDPRQLSEVLEELTGYVVPEEKAEAFARYAEGRQKPLLGQLGSFSAQLGQLMANHCGIGWTGTSHTADYCPVVARGPGANRFAGLLQNTDVFRHYTDLARIHYRNPEVPLLAESGPSAAEVERWQLA